MQTITAAPLYPFLRERGITVEQVEAVEIELHIDADTGPMAEGALTLLPVAVVLEALECIDNHPWKDTNPMKFRKHLQAELKATRIGYWVTGADKLPATLEGR